MIYKHIYQAVINEFVGRCQSPASVICLFSWCYNPLWLYEGWNFNSGNYLFTTDTK